MKGLSYATISSTKYYDALLKALYISVKQKVEEIDVPKVQIIAVDGNEPPASTQYQDAISALYGVGYTLKMGLKFKKLPQPNGYFDYKVGGLETLWWGTQGEINISDAKTLRWKAFLMAPAFIDRTLFRQAVEQAKAKKPDIPYDSVRLTTLHEGHSVQMLHIGSYEQEEPTIKQLLEYIKDHNLQVNGHHHEIYISDPRRTKPEKLKTVIRYPVNTYE
ncbi:MAG: hypothetical protein A2134_02480 [Candidatus Woykebacteria bacterium RBG_16_39_9b]|uniref:GyrI-like small molecule binding domain-containing protein n=1 Tax=Candidatus Woykebacteria bacterium RBG_16_39_9b TaxID=1802595 RepID=A0A1G1WB87_9BACT|nr:MAG: hypothetical protein A2134_02480 [Candidatus Woykebacteria bacterium RBG_16_39_9b]